MSMMRARVRGHRWVDHPAAAVMKARVPGQWVDCPAAVVMEAREQGRYRDRLSVRALSIAGVSMNRDRHSSSSRVLEPRPLHRSVTGGCWLASVVGSGLLAAAGAGVVLLCSTPADRRATVGGAVRLLLESVHGAQR
ncbi:hypothetical protein ACOMHN_055197 [Nucella lapillus]